VRIAIVAGESSGDLLGKGIIAAIKERYPDTGFEGVAGPGMAAEGCRVLAPVERLSVMGFAEVLRRVPDLLRLRHELSRHFVTQPPDAFVGIDAPDFNLPLARHLKRAGIPTVQYVSPSVWAWRRYRVRSMRRAVDLVLTLFPFEAKFYEQEAVGVQFVGHPLAHRLPPDLSREQARALLGLPMQGTIVALLPGSRVAEVRHLAQVFLSAARWCSSRRTELHFVAPLANTAAAAAFWDAGQRSAPGLPLTALEGRSIEAMVAADAVLVASGTATLEAMLIPRPMVVAYRASWLTYQVLRRLVKVPHIALPNLLTGRAVVPEFIQEAATPENLGRALLQCLEEPARFRQQTDAFMEVRRSLGRVSDREAAAAVLALIHRRRGARSFG
jgi:lipid-A-disaccharide synthase